MEFVRGTPGYAFDCGAGFFCEEQIFTERWFQPGGVPDGFRMWEQSSPMEHGCQRCCWICEDRNGFGVWRYQRRCMRYCAHIKRADIVG